MKSMFQAYSTERTRIVWLVRLLAGEKLGGIAIEEGGSTDLFKRERSHWLGANSLVTGHLGLAPNV